MREPGAAKVWHEVLKPVSAEMQTSAPLLARRIVDRYQSELPRIVPDAAAVAEQSASVEASLRQIAQSIASAKTRIDSTSHRQPPPSDAPAHNGTFRSMTSSGRCALRRSKCGGGCLIG